MAAMMRDWSDFYDQNPKPEDFEKYSNNIEHFVAENDGQGVRIALITSGGTTVPLEHNTVRFVDNFSAGTRGSTSAEFFLEHDYAIIFLYRLKSLEPFSRHFVEASFLDMLETNDGTVTVKSNFHSTLAPIVENYKKAKTSGRLLSVPFTTLTDYLWFLRVACTMLNKCHTRALIYLAAAVSDFYIPSEKMAVHKIQSNDGPPTIELQLVPKMLRPLVNNWVPNAFVVSFKLETDESILISKARAALGKYKHHVVIANILQTRKRRVVMVTKDADYPIVVGENEVIEREIVTDIVAQHNLHIKAKVS